MDVSGIRKQAWKDAENSASPNTSLQLPITTQTITVWKKRLGRAGMCSSPSLSLLLLIFLNTHFSYWSSSLQLCKSGIPFLFLKSLLKYLLKAHYDKTQFFASLTLFSSRWSPVNFLKNCVRFGALLLRLFQCWTLETLADYTASWLSWGDP